MIKRKYLVLLLMPIILMGFLSVGYSQIVNDTSIISMSGAGWSLKVDGVLASSIDSRNTPYMTAKSSTEKELFLELATLEDCKSGVVQFKVDMAGLTAYKQLPLTQEEIDSGSFRPKNVENSFALFDDSRRKVAHIYGSKITDSKGVEVWLDQNLQDGLLTVILPKPEVLQTLSFPVLLDPTFGFTNIGATSWQTEEYKQRTLQLNLTDDNATCTLISIYMDNAGNTTSVAKAAIYSDNSTEPYSLLEESNEISLSSTTAWKNFTINVTLDAGLYWVSVWSPSYTTIYYDTGTAEFVRGNPVSYTTWQDPFGSYTDHFTDRECSYFVTYTTDAEPTPTPTPSPSPSPTPEGATATPFPEGAMDETDWWISILVLLLIIINIFLMMLPFALVRFTFGILSLFLCMLALSYQIPLSPYLQTAGLLISALAMLFSVRARE